jgi:hypothetical protein
MHVLAAVASTSSPPASDRLRQIPTEFWWKFGLGVAGLVVLVVVLRKVAKLNKLALALGVFLVVSFVGFNWIYERNEPAWASPVVQWLSGFMPTKGKVTGGR